MEGLEFHVRKLYAYFQAVDDNVRGTFPQNFSGSGIAVNTDDDFGFWSPEATSDQFLATVYVDYIDSRKLNFAGRSYNSEWCAAKGAILAQCCR